MAGEVALSQALSYARDLKSAYEAARVRERELGHANERLRKGYQQSLQYAQDLKKTYARLQRAIFQSLLGLANALEAKDPYTRGHSTRVAELAGQLAMRIGLPRPATETIAQAALLHDLGKIGVPESILRKPGALTEQEWEIMRRHPVTGAQIVAPLEFFDDGAVIVRHHHERLDGSGYPEGYAVRPFRRARGSWPSRIRTTPSRPDGRTAPASRMPRPSTFFAARLAGRSMRARWASLSTCWRCRRHPETLCRDDDGVPTMVLLTAPFDPGRSAACRAPAVVRGPGGDRRSRGLAVGLGMATRTARCAKSGRQWRGEPCTAPFSSADGSSRPGARPVSRPCFTPPWPCSWPRSRARSPSGARCSICCPRCSCFRRGSP